MSASRPRWAALACDYDGTIAERGTVAPDTRDALARLAGAGVRVVLVTGRRLDDLAAIAPLACFDRVVAENGAVLACPRTGASRALSTWPRGALLSRLRALGVRFDLGEVIVAADRRDEARVRAALVDAALADPACDGVAIANGTSLMALPRGVDKRSGLAAALAELGVPAAATVGVGDGENDAELLAASGLAVAVASAVPEVRARAEIVTRGAAGRGVVEIAAAILDGTLAPPR